MLTKPDALQLVGEYVRSAKKRRHVVAVSAIMKGLAKRIGANEEEWELVGLLHDLDCDLVAGDMRKHGLVASEMLEGRLPENCLHAIRAHDYRTGVKPESPLDCALIASDCVWGLIVRVTLAVPDRKIRNVKLSALKRGCEAESFPSFLKSGMLMCRNLGLTLAEFLQTVLASIPDDLCITVDDL